MSCKRYLPLAAAAALAGCGTTHGDTVSADVGLGEAVKFNAAVQTINPDPVYAEGGALPGDNGELGAEAVERYRKGEVTPVEEVQTTASSGSGSGSR